MNLWSLPVEYTYNVQIHAAAGNKMCTKMCVDTTSVPLWRGISNLAVSSSACSEYSEQQEENARYIIPRVLHIQLYLRYHRRGTRTANHRGTFAFRVQFVRRCMGKSALSYDCICDAYLCLSGCDHRALDCSFLG